MPADADRHRGPCPVQDAVGALGGKWAVAVVGRLARGEARFGRLRAQVTGTDGAPVSSKVLAAELRRLTEADVVARRERGAAVSYRLTPRGRALVPVLDALGEWSESGAGPPPDAA
ncbi:winged helix-turn-helix transcriptional regulator [Rubrivirga sp.]|uniref:winged helix-turn-helix transcriptional regulator n=1 Tax=Rubrivirga sp. TaxID=1885344 RepID=UPI003B52C8EB